MNLFGCKFCDPETGVCDRKNFDSLLWATVTVFQVSRTKIHQNIDSLSLKGFDSRGLEYCSLRWDGEDQVWSHKSISCSKLLDHPCTQSLGCSVLRGPDDVWQLCSLQPPGRHPGRGILKSGKNEPIIVNLRIFIGTSLFDVLCIDRIFQSFRILNVPCIVALMCIY